MISFLVNINLGGIVVYFIRLTSTALLPYIYHREEKDMAKVFFVAKIENQEFSFCRSFANGKGK